jgi:hypothetical protein
MLYNEEVKSDTAPQELMEFRGAEQPATTLEMSAKDDGLKKHKTVVG